MTNRVESFEEWRCRRFFFLHSSLSLFFTFRSRALFFLCLINRRYQQLLINIQLRFKIPRRRDEVFPTSGEIERERERERERFGHCNSYRESCGKISYFPVAVSSIPTYILLSSVSLHPFQPPPFLLLLVVVDDDDVLSMEDSALRSRM